MNPRSSLMSTTLAEERFVLGLDVGTQSLRAALFDLQGRSVAFGVAPIDTTFPRPTWAEQDPAQWWSAARAAVQKALAQVGAAPEQVAAIGLDCTACTVLACDLAGNPLRPALLWMDQRSFREAETISATGHPVLRYVSGRVSPEWMLPKALWLKNHEPETYRRAGRIVECTDRIVPLGKGEARLDAAAALDLGLDAGTPVAQGGIDAYLGMLGLGATSAGDVAVIVGSSTCHLAQSRGGVFGSGAAGCYPDATVEGLYTIEAGQTATGSILDWYRRHFAGREQAEAERRGVPVYQVLDEEAALIPAGAEGLIVRDDWQGNRSPYKNPQARGAIVGLSLAHGPGHVFRALYEATACGTRHILEDAAAHGLAVARIFIGGGGARSALWLQIHADVLKKPVHLTRESESCALGSAMTAAVAAGAYRDFDEAARAIVAIEKTVEPNPANAEVYDELFGHYVELYKRLNVG